MMFSTRHAEPFRDERVQFRFWHRAGTVFVAAGFHHARTGRQLKPQIVFHQIIQQMHEGKGGAQEERVGRLASGVWQKEHQRPHRNPVSTSRHRLRAKKPGPARGDARPSEFLPHGFKHVDERRMRHLHPAAASEKWRMEDGGWKLVFRSARHHSQIANPARHLEKTTKPQRRLINRQRFRAMKMPAGLLLRRAAGMKDGGAFVRREYWSIPVP